MTEGEGENAGNVVGYAVKFAGIGSAAEDCEGCSAGTGLLEPEGVSDGVEDIRDVDGTAVTFFCDCGEDDGGGEVVVLARFVGALVGNAGAGLEGNRVGYRVGHREGCIEGMWMAGSVVGVGVGTIEVFCFGLLEVKDITETFWKVLIP